MSCELLTCALTRLHIDFAAEEKSKGDRGEMITMFFNVEMGTHVSNDHQFKVSLSAKFSENTNEMPLGFQVEATIVGFFKVSAEVEKSEAHAKAHGVTTLYGTLRGIIMSATASFPGGQPMILKSRTAQQLLGMEKAASVDSSVGTEGKPQRRQRRSPAKEGVASAHRVFGEVLEKTDPKAPAKRH